MPVIRSFKKWDLKRVQEIAMEAFADENVSFDLRAEKMFGKMNNTNWKQRKAKTVENETRANPKGALVAVVDGKIEGFLTSSLDRFSSTGKIINLGVSRKHQGEGIGKALMAKAVEYFKKNKMKYARLETVVTNETGVYLYPKLGFKEINRQINFLMKI